MKLRILLLALVLLPLARAQTPASQNITSTSAPNNCATIGIDPAHSSTVTIEVTGTWSATLQPEISLHGKAAANTQVTPSTSSTAQSTVTANGIYTAIVAGADQFMLCATAYTSGTAVVDLNVSAGIAVNQLGGGGGGGGSGTVTSVGLTLNSGSSCGAAAVTGSPVSTSGTLNINFTGVSGDIVTFNGSNCPIDSGTLLAALAPLASPTFTGTPAAPTPGSNVNTTQIPTSAWVNTYFATLASPTFTGTVTIPSGASISGFAPLASPTFTGTPAAPTAAADANSTQLATTAYVDRMKTRSIAFQFGTPGGSAISTGVLGYLTVPFACTIGGWSIQVDAGTATVKTLKVAAGTAIPTIGSNSISTSGVAISTGTVIQSTTVTDFTSTAVTANDIVAADLITTSGVGYIAFQLVCGQ